MFNTILENAHCFAIMMAPNSNPNVDMIHSLISTKHTARFSCYKIYFFITDSSSFFQVGISNDVVGGLYCIEFSFLYCSTLDSIYEGLED